MADFDKKQIEVLKGNYTTIAKSVGCTREYVKKVLDGEVGNVRGLKARKVKDKANQLLEVLYPAHV